LFQEITVTHKFLPRLLILLLIVLLSACATVKKEPITGIIPGKEVATLQSPISISVKSGEHSTSGRGFLVFKEPDRFHMAILSPFGLTLFEVFSDKNRLTCVVPSRETAYTGSLSELPGNSPLQSISMMRWVVARSPDTPPAGTKEVTAPSGDKFYFDERGLVDRKISPQGDEASYEDYRNRNGVAFPDTIVITSRYGATVKVAFDDPDVNSPVEEAALVPNLEGLTVLPLAEFKGF
jgi:hypothetical protein